jgi:hypothetical protein
MTKFDEVVAAFGAREHAGHVMRQEIEDCALKLYRMFRQVGGVAGSEVTPVPLSEGRGALPNDYLGFVDGWLHLRFQLEFASPNTQLPCSIILLVRMRQERGQTVVKFYEDGRPIPFSCDDEGLRSVCEQLYDEIIAWLRREPSLEDVPHVGFHRE